MSSASAAISNDLVIPRTSRAAWVERLLWLFLMSFALDYRSESAREGGSGAGLDQLLFLGSCGMSSLGIFALGWKHLTVRPGAWIIAFWGIFVAFMLCNSLLQGVSTGRSLRVALPLVFCLFGMMNAHIAGCMGISPSKIVTPIFAAACINVIWRIVQGFAFKDASLDTVRYEVLSPATQWIAAWIGCTILLRGRFTWALPFACVILFAGAFISVTRSLIFPILASAMACSFCFALGVRWGNFKWSSMVSRLLPVGSAVILMLLALGAAAVMFPELLERWNERLFHNAATVNLGSDISYLTRRAEADAILHILTTDPVHFIHGKGIGASYYWDRAYMPEINLVIPMDESGFDDIWFAGHSVWTYSLFSGGVIALLSFAALLMGTAWNSLSSARANASDPGPDHWLAFLPFVAACCLLSETLTSNPFQERLVGIIFGVMAGLPQAFVVRSSWLHTIRRT